LENTQVPEQGALGEGIIALLVSYSDKEELEAKAPIVPQEPMESPSKEQESQAKDTTQKEESQSEPPSVPQEPVDKTPHEYSAKPQ
jgi:hypothetical protein